MKWKSVLVGNETHAWGYILTLIGDTSRSASKCTQKCRRSAKVGEGRQTARKWEWGDHAQIQRNTRMQSVSIAGQGQTHTCDNNNNNNGANNNARVHNTTATIAQIARTAPITIESVQMMAKLRAIGMSSITKCIGHKSCSSWALSFSCICHFSGMLVHYPCSVASILLLG